MWLNQTDRDYLNSVYAIAYKKWFAGKFNMGNIQMMNYAEAVEQAKQELEEFYQNRREEIKERTKLKIDAIEREHTRRTNAINNDASSRGLLGSTIVLHQLENARNERSVKLERVELDKQSQLERFAHTTERQIRTNARRIMSDQAALLRVGLAADQHSYRVMFDTRGVLANNERQRAMDEEIYGEYKRWLLTHSPEVALAYVDGDPLFYFNLSSSYYQRLVDEFERRV